MAALRRPAASCGSPQKAITNHIGMRTTSKNRKNTIRSNATNVPSIPTSSSSTSATRACARPASGAIRVV